MTDPTDRPRWPRASITLLAAALAAGALACQSPTTAPVAPAPPPKASPELDFLLGLELEAEGRLDEATVAFERALERDPDSVYLLKQLAELAARRNDLPTALEYAERAIAIEPDEGLRLFLGTLYRMRREPEDARRVLTDEQGTPTSVDAGLLLFNVASEAGRHDEARVLAEWLIDAEPDGLRGWLALAEALDRMGDPMAAEAALRRGLAVHPGELALYAALARSRRARGDRVGEVEIYREILVDRPDHAATMVNLAEAQLALGHSEEALDTLRRVEEAHPRDVRTMLRIAFLEFEQGNLDPARARFERALAVNPRAYEVAYFLGVTLRRLDRVDDARRAFEQIPSDHGRFAEARTQIAAILEEAGEIEQAIEQVQVARASGDSRALDFYLASLTAKTGDTDGALEFLEELREEDPDDVEILYNIGVIYGEANDPEAALGTMQQVLEANPDHAGALNYVGYTWAERGTNLDQAEEMIVRALELRPGDGFITDSLGWVFYMRARPLYERGNDSAGRLLLDRALEELLRAAELTGGDPVISEHLGDVYLLRGDKARALQMYEEALALEPRFGEQPNLLEKLESLREELGRP